MIDNSAVLKRLFDAGKIDLSWDSFLESVPAPLPSELDFGKIEGMLLGVADGDSLGKGSESMSPRERGQVFGEIRHYLPQPLAAGRAVGLPSDDTQLTFWTVEQYLSDGGLVPANLARRFCSEHIYGMGRTVKGFIQNHKDTKLQWDESGVKSAGNGALMRISPVLLPHIKKPSHALWADAAIAAMITHNDAASTAACVAFVNILWKALALREAPPSGWWVDSFCEVASRLEGDTHHKPRHPSIPYKYDGPLWQYTKMVVEGALSKAMPILDACNSWHSGAYLLETVPSVLYILESLARRPEEAILCAIASPTPGGLPRISGGSALTTALSRPAQDSLTLRPTRLPARLQADLCRLGFSKTGNSRYRNPLPG